MAIHTNYPDYFTLWRLSVDIDYFIDRMEAKAVRYYCESDKNQKNIISHSIRDSEK